MKDKEIVTVNGQEFEYDKYYKRLNKVIHDDRETTTPPEVLCPICHNDVFQISYGSYECIAHCKCGHSMTIYDG